MSEPRTYKILAVLIAIALLVPACGSSQQQESIISTSVAQTVQAQIPPATETLAVSPTSPVLADTPASLDPLPATATDAPPVSSASTEDPVTFCTAGAAFVAETIPDKTIVQPGKTFTKAWKIQNTGTCAWDASWKLVFYSGDLMGGSTFYNLPRPTAPGETVEIPVVLTAPAGDGAYTGEWMLKSPWGKVFGVGQYSVPVSVSIVVGSGTPENHKTETVFGVTAVTYSVDRRCTAANTFYTITAYISTSGPVKVIFTTIQSDGHIEKNNLLVFPEAMTKSFSWEWSQVKGSSPNPRWAGINVTSPVYQEFDKVTLPDLCTFKP